MGRVWAGIWNDDGFRDLDIHERLLLLGLMTLAKQDGVVRMTEKAIWATLDPNGERTFQQFMDSLNSLRLPTERKHGWMNVGLPFVARLGEGARFIQIDTEYTEPQRQPLPRSVRDAVVERDGMVCQLCGHEIPDGDLHIDHIYPVARGGGNEMSNLQAAHSRCNISKGARI
jgi:hypothetical protein